MAFGLNQIKYKISLNQQFFISIYFMFQEVYMIAFNHILEY